MHLGNTPEEIELQRKLLLMRFFAVAGNLVMIPLLLASLYYRRWEAALILTVVIATLTTAITLAHRYQKTRAASLFVASGLWMFSCYLTVTGGVNGTGVFFSFSLVVLMIMMAGWRPGMLLGLGYCAVVFVVFIADPGFAFDYPESTEIRIGASTAFIVLLTLVAEWIHVQSYSAIKVTAEHHQRNSLTDSLTTLLNRSGLEQELRRWANAKQPAVVALIDIDHFKSINDEYGHDVGDKVLSAFAKVLRNNLKQEDIVSRWGGEEFIVVFTDVPEKKAAKVLDALRILVESRTFTFADQEVRLQFSAGLASFEGESGFHHGLKRADQRVYRAKRAGRNQVIATEPEPSPSETHQV